MTALCSKKKNFSERVLFLKSDYVRHKSIFMIFFFNQIHKIILPIQEVYTNQIFDQMF